MVYQISCDLNTAGKDYSPLYVAIKRLGDWIHPLDSSWFVDCGLSTDEIVDRLIPLIGSRDKLIVSGIERRKVQGWASDSFWNWIEEKMY